MPGKLLKYCRRFLLVAALVLVSLLGISPFYIYTVFNQEIPVARLRFEQTGSDTWIAQLSQDHICTPRYYPLQGDQFQLDAGFVKWKGPAVLLGLKPRYRLDRLSGRFSDVDTQNTLHPVAHNLAPEVLFDIFASDPDGAEGLLKDTQFGSSVFMDIDPLSEFSVYATEDALIVRSAPVQDFSRENGILQIAITRGCGSNDPTIENWMLNLNELALTIFQTKNPD